MFLVLALPALGFWQRWNIYDQWRLHNYVAPAKVVTLANETSVNETGRRLFYVNHPSLDTKEAFRGHCTSGEQTIVLGCFVPYNGIYLQEIADPRLAGVMQVTAAHEMLHAGYQRLSTADKKKVDGLLKAQFAATQNQRIKDTIEDYKKAGADINNELHSILGTEVRTLSPELETYYKRYFTDRSKVVTYSEQYEAAFTSRKALVADYDKRLEAIKTQVDTKNSQLVASQAQLDNMQQELNRLSAAKKYDEYNAAVPVFNNLVRSYNAQVGQVRALIDEYNNLVKARNDIALEESELVKAIDSRPNTVKTE